MRFRLQYHGLFETSVSIILDTKLGNKGGVIDIELLATLKDQLSSMLGVRSVKIDEYGVTLSKILPFSWEEIFPDIFYTLRNHIEPKFEWIEIGNPIVLYNNVNGTPVERVKTGDFKLHHYPPLTSLL